MNTNFLLVLTVIFSFSLTSKAIANSDTIFSSRFLFADTLVMKQIDSIINTSKIYLGKPYRFKNSLGEVMDCSNFIKYIFSYQNISLPRSSSEIATYSKKIAFEEIKKGDLLFFKGRNISSSSIGHVSLVIEKDENHIKMIHSSRRGVVIDDFPLRYYKERFLFAGRLPVFENVFIEKIPSNGSDEIEEFKIPGEPD